MRIWTPEQENYTLMWRRKMGKYTVISGQNIYDIALHIYGSIEGVVDLLMNNSELSLAATLKAGDELSYTDGYIINPDIVAYNRMHNIVPANGERSVYYKEPPVSCSRVAVKIILPHAVTSGNLAIANTTPVYIDWGDNSAIEEMSPTSHPCHYRHYFDNQISHPRKIRIYSYGITEIDLSGLDASAVYVLGSNAIERFTLQNATLRLDCVSSLEQVYYLNLSGVKTKSLLPLLENKKLMTLDLTDARITREVVDEYLIGLVKKHRGRRNCEIILTVEPSGVFREPERDENLSYILTCGMEAIWVITNEPTWNESVFWKFNINGTIYTSQP